MIVYTILETAKANGLNPENYLDHPLTVLPDWYFRKTLGIQFTIDDLMPWSKKMQKMFEKTERALYCVYNDEVASNALLKRVTKHFTVVISPRS